MSDPAIAEQLSEINNDIMEHPNADDINFSTDNPNIPNQINQNFISNNKFNFNLTPTPNKEAPLLDNNDFIANRTRAKSAATHQSGMQVQ